MSRESLVILGWLAGIVVALFLLWSLWWALFSDRSRGMRRCPKCWHVNDPGNTATANLRCPECGHEAREERDLLRTRRKWVLAVMCVVGLCAETAWVQAAVAESGWWSLLPDRVLIAIGPWMGDTADARNMRASLRDRLVCGRIDPADVVRLFELARTGDPESSPGSVQWRARYLPWIQALHGPGFWNAYANAPEDNNIAYLYPSRGCTIQTNHTAASFTFDSVSFEAFTIIVVDNLNLFTFEDIGRFEQLFVNSDTADVVQIGLSHPDAVDFAFENFDQHNASITAI